MANPTFTPGIGRLAADFYDFDNHTNGSKFRHNASQINTNNPSAIYGNATTVEGGLENLTSFANSALTDGKGFVTVGDGYDTWHNANGSINFDKTVPPLDSLLNPIFSDIINNVPLSPYYSRIQRGGVVLIKSGTYIVENPIVVPPGITLLGEGYGTKIVNVSGLNLSGSSPIVFGEFAIATFTGTPTTITTTTAGPISTLVNGQLVNVYGTGQSTVDGTWTVSNVIQSALSTTFTLVGSTGGVSGTSGFVTICRPIFTIAPDTNRSNNDLAVNPTLFMFSQSTQIMNMVIADNFVEAPILGDFFYRVAQNTISSTLVPGPITPVSSTVIPALINQVAGSSLVLDRVYFLGRGLGFGGYTSTAVALNNSQGTGSTGSMLEVNNCFIDGFSFPISFLNAAGSADYLTITNSKIRASGFTPTTGTPNTGIGTFIFANDTNAMITGNTLYATGFYTVPYATNSLYYINDTMLSAPTTNGRAKLTITGNNLIVDKTLSGIQSLPAIYDPNTLLGDAGWISSLVYGNNFNDQDTTIVNNSASTTIGANYTVQPSDSLILAARNIGNTLPITINLPPLSAAIDNKVLTIKDFGAISTPLLPLYITPNGTDEIDSLGSGISFVLLEQSTSITLQASLSNGAWFIV